MQEEEEEDEEEEERKKERRKKKKERKKERKKKKRSELILIFILFHFEKGKISVEDRLWLGPSAHGEFVRVTVLSIHRNRMPCRSVEVKLN